MIEKSVLVDNLIAKISKSADTLTENKDFKDTLFTRIPSELNCACFSASMIENFKLTRIFHEKPKRS